MQHATTAEEGCCREVQYVNLVQKEVIVSHLDNNILNFSKQRLGEALSLLLSFYLVNRVVSVNLQAIEKDILL
jgi:hypothetical protein